MCFTAAENSATPAKTPSISPNFPTCYEFKSIRAKAPSASAKRFTWLSRLPPMFTNPARRICSAKIRWKSIGTIGAKNSSPNCRR